MVGLLIALIGYGQVAAPVHSLAIIADLHGDVSIHDRAGNQRPSAIYQALFEGDKILVRNDGVISVAFADGTVHRNTGNGDLTITPLGCEPKTAVKSSFLRARSNLRVNSALKELIQRGGASTTVLRSASSGMVPHAPLFDATVLTGRPTLTWDPFVAAKAYRVAVREGSSPILLVNDETQETRFLVPKVLTEGAVYSWNVIALLPDDDLKLVVDSRFMVARRTQIPDLSGLREMAKLHAADDKWILAETLRQSQLLGDALPLYEGLASNRPNDSNLRAILSDLYLRAGSFEKAHALRLDPPLSKPK